MSGRPVTDAPPLSIQVIPCSTLTLARRARRVQKVAQDKIRRRRNTHLMGSGTCLLLARTDASLRTPVRRGATRSRRT